MPALASRAANSICRGCVIKANDITAKPSLAASNYLNTAPLIWSFVHGSRKGAVQLIEAVPARCAELLEEGRVGVALVPVIEYQRLSGITVVPDICIGSRERVRSVVLVTSVDDLKSIHTVALDESSRTSAALVRIIFREFLGFEPQWSCSAPNLKQMLSENDAALIIGDPAMTFTRAGGLRVFDMAGLWREYTGLGFVFALWMIRDDASAADHQIDFRAACDEGLLKAEEIIDFYQPLLDLPRTELRTYLHENISFYMDAGMRAGLDLYYELARKHGLIPAVKPLKSIDT